MQNWWSVKPTGLKGDNALPPMHERGKALGSPFKGIFATAQERAITWHCRPRFLLKKPLDGRRGLAILVGDATQPMTVRELAPPSISLSRNWTDDFYPLRPRPRPQQCHYRFSRFLRTPPWNERTYTGGTSNCCQKIRDEAFGQRSGTCTCFSGKYILHSWLEYNDAVSIFHV